MLAIAAAGIGGKYVCNGMKNEMIVYESKLGT
jgi:hypothetical protein